MKLGIISDTHDNAEAAMKSKKIFEKENITNVIHLGDFVAPFTLEIFKGFKLYGVFGNNDGEKILLLRVAEELGFEIYEAPFELTLYSKKFLLIHGWGSVERTKSIVDSFARSGKYDFVLYGHTHKKDLRKIDHTTIINPGEACGYLTGMKTVAILDMEMEEIKFISFD